MKKLFKNSMLLLDLPQGDILSAGYIIMLLTLINGIFGLLRSRLLTSFFTPDLIGIYLASFVIPDNILQILVLSAMGTAFIPVFTKYKKTNMQWEATQAILASALVIFLFCIALAFIFAKPLSFLVAPGIQKDHPSHIDLLVNLTRIILLGQIFFFFSYIATGILQSYQRFIMPALSPIFYNIGIIIGIVFLAPLFGMYGVAIGIIIGALFHLLIQLPFILRLGFRVTLQKPSFSHPAVKEVAILMAPRVLSVGIERAKLTIDTFLSSLISLSSITYLNFALQVATFPVSLIAAAIAQAALPFFAKAASEHNKEDFRKYLLQSLMHIVFLLAPFSILLMVFHTPVIRLIFGGEKFSWGATVLTGQTFAILSAGLIAQGANNILARGFYAFLDTKTPLIMTCISMLGSVLLSILFIVVFKFDVQALAFSTTLGAFVNAFLLFLLLEKKVGGLIDAKFIKAFAKILLISFLLGVFSYGIFKSLEPHFNTTYTFPLLLFTVVALIISGGFYLLLSVLFNLEEYKELFLLFRKAKNMRSHFMQGGPR